MTFVDARMPLVRLLLVGVLATVASGCGDASEDLPAPAPDDIAPAPAPELAEGASTGGTGLGDEQLDFATYFIEALGRAPIRLRNGEWEASGGSRAVTLAPSPRLRGDLDGDGDGEVAAVLIVGTSTGFESLLVAVGTAAGRPAQEAIIGLGRSVTVRSMRMEGRALVLDLFRLPAPGRPPSPPEEQRFLLEQQRWTRVGG